VNVVMAPREKVEIRLSSHQIDRADAIAELVDEKRSEILRQALDNGLEVLEEKIEQREIRRLQLANAKLVNTKLKKLMTGNIQDAIGLIEGGGDMAAVLALLRESVA
jgi:predicted transcriptional regulator